MQFNVLKCNDVVINGSKISIHRFIATTLFRMDKMARNDHIHQAISTLILPDECGHSLQFVHTKQRCRNKTMN